jgi:ribosomal protein S18 acetylase RimI-like enzyme
MPFLSPQNPDIVVRKGHIHEVVGLYPSIPEFESPHPAATYEARLFSAPRYLMLVACIDDEIVGFKVGYERQSDGSFYSWMGGVAQQHRRRGVAQTLADHMETWAQKQGYQRIRFKTRNSHRAMLLFGIQQGFQIVEVEKRDEIGEYRILLEKELR